VHVELLYRNAYGQDNIAMKSAVNPSWQRRSRGSLTRTEVVDAALALADEQGIEALSMPALARRLKCGVMSIYGHVDSKEDLLEAVAERAFAELPLPQPLPDDPARILKAWGRALREVLVKHAFLPVILLTQPVVGPGIFHGVEYLLTALDRAEYPAKEGVHAVYAVLTYTVGFLAWEIPRTRKQSPEAYAGKWRQVFAMLSPRDFPFAGALLAELSTVAGEDQFQLGLDALVSGLMGSQPSHHPSP